MPDLKQMPDMKQMRLLGIVAATAIGLYVCYLLALPFLPALTSALVLAIILYPAHRRVEERLRNQNLAALVSVSVAAVAVGLPLIFVAQQLVREAVNGATYLEEVIRGWNAVGFMSDYPTLSAVARWIENQLDPAGTVRICTMADGTKHIAVARLDQSGRDVRADVLSAVLFSAGPRTRSAGDRGSLAPACTGDGIHTVPPCRDGTCDPDRHRVCRRCAGNAGRLDVLVARPAHSGLLCQCSAHS